MAHNLLLLGMCTEQSEWTERAALMLQQMAGSSTRYTYSFGYWAAMLQRYERGIKTAVCSGTGAGEAIKHILEQFIPHGYLITSGKEISEPGILKDKFFPGELHIFVCSQDACFRPVDNIEAALHLINQ